MDEQSCQTLTEFEQRAAYFDGIDILDRGSQVHAIGEFQGILDFPPAPKLSIDGKLDPKKASAVEMRGQQLFFGKPKCAECRPAR